jgi:cytosol alanyl aminopeptidase
MLPAMKPTLGSALLVMSLAACGSREPRPAVQPAAPPAPAPSGPTPPALRLDRSVVPVEVALELTIDPARPDFTGVATIQADIERPTRLIWLHGKRLDIARATVNAGKEVVASATAHGEFLALTLPETVGPGRAGLRIEYRGQMPTTEQEGVFRQSEADKNYVYTQFESTGARLAFPGFDEPSFKIPWQVTLHVPKGMVALSNTDPEHEAHAGEVHTLRFRKTRPLPSYLVAFAVGPFDLVELGRAGRNNTRLRIAVPKGRGADARYARKVTGEILVALEEYFDMPYPYEKLDSVVLPTFLGAMENPGLITYASRLILAKPNEETPQFQQTYAAFAGHEIAHQWFGDLVTMAWWDDIWLNESFASFMAARVIDDWQKSWGMPMLRVKQAQLAFEKDSLVSARKVQSPIVEHNDIAGSFDAISYQKGGALLDMFEAWMGRPSFQKAIRRYLERHAWGNATSKDFIAALAAESRPDIAAAFESFITQGGIPLISVGLECPAGKPPDLTLAQERFLPVGSRGSADQTWSVPMCVGFPRGRKNAVQCFLFSDRTARIPLDTDSCPAWVDGNSGGHGYYRVAYAGDLGKKLDQAALDSAGRASALFNLEALVEAGRTPMSELLAVIPSVARDRDPEILGVALDLAASIEPFVDEGQRPHYKRFLARSFAGPARTVGWKPRRGEPIQVSKLRPRLVGTAAMTGEDPSLVAGARRLARRFLADPRTLDPQLAAVVLSVAVRTGDDKLAGELEAAFGKTQDHNVRAALLSGMVMSRDPARRDRTLALLGSGSLTVEELATLAFSAMFEPTTRGPTYDYVVANLEKVAAGISPLVRSVLVELGGFFCDEQHRQHVDTVFRAKVKDMPGGTKRVGEVLERLDLCIERRKRHGADVAAFLVGQ